MTQIEHARRVGRWVGGAMFANFCLELVSNFKLQSDLFAGEGFLPNAASHPITIGSIIVLGALSGLLSIWIAATMWSRCGRAFPGLAGTYFALAAGLFAASVLELSTFIAMRTLSELYVAAGADAGARFDTARAVVRGLRNGMHFTGKLLDGVEVLAFYLLLFRAGLLPRWLSVSGIATAVLQMASVALPLFGGNVIYGMLAPLGVVYLVTFCWLIFKGFAPEPDQAAQSGAGAPG